MGPRQASDEKAAHILKAALNVLTRQGYARTTIKEVAAEAGVSRGLLHYYFKNKEEMLFMVVRESVVASSRLVETVFAAGRTRQEIAASICQAIRSYVEKTPDSISILFESWSLARQSQSAREQLEELHAYFRQALARGLESAMASGALTPASPPMEVATVLTAFIDGLAFELLVVSGLGSNDEFWRVTQRTLEAMLAEA
ncbi:hypothetical protein AAU61_03140 [Desulfocarbo indianensis]|nr:hypothetical protein AAU61_03140 [Desulfocarbo indianensis]